MHCAIANPYKKHILQNLVKGVFIASPTPAQGPQQIQPPQPGHPQRLHTLRHHYHL